MRYHHQNLTNGRLPLWRYGRAWWGKLHWGWHCFYPTSLLLVSVRRWGFSVYLRWFGFYASWNDDDGYEHPQWEVSLHDGCVWLEHPWIRQGEWRWSDPWWRKQIVLHVVDWLIGGYRCETVKGEPFDVFVPMPEGSYRATATPKTMTWRRRWYWPIRRRESVWLKLDPGIPHSGKGENSWDCGDDALCGIGGDTVEDAIANAVRSSLRSRRRHEHDSHGTGREPVKIIGPKMAPDAAKGAT